MIKPSLPANEPQRIAALEAYQVLDTEAEKAFDDLTLLASRICGPPIALVSLIDPERQWFKSKVGLDACETERDIAFCAHAIHKDDVMEVCDTFQDERFHDNPLVTGAPFIRFYAGAPLITPEGFAIGTLCVISPKPMQLSNEQKENLTMLARAVVSQLELRKKVRELDRVSQFKSDFLSNMSHEIRTPIHGITGTLHLLQNMALNREQRHLVSLALGSADALTELVNDILDLSRIEAGKLELQSEAFDLASLLAEVGATQGIKAGEKYLELLCPARHIPSGKVQGDSLRLRQILNNLISNAIKFTHEGFVSVDLTLTPQTDGSDQQIARFEVRDSGIGLTESQLNTLFNRFQQATADTAHRYGGSGLGLNICQQLVEMMNGRIGVNSQYGEGSLFWFEIPLTLIDPIEDVLPERPTGTRVLVVESRPVSQQFMRSLFAQWQIDAEVVPPSRAFKELEAAGSDKDQPAFSHLILDDGAELLNNGRLSEQLSEFWPADQPPQLILLRQPGSKQKTLDLSPYQAVIGLPLYPQELLSVLQGKVMEHSDERDSQLTRSAQFSGRVLIAEDNKTNQVVAQGMLTQMGLEVEIANDGYEALHIMRTERFDIIFMDCQMPVMDGYRTTQELRQAEGLQTDNKVPVIALTANAMQDDKRRCLEAGMDEFLTKPIDPARLSAVLERFLPGRKTNSDSAGTPQEADNTFAQLLPKEDQQLTFDVDEFRQRLGGDTELMQLVMEAALEDIHRLLAELEQTADEALPANLHQLKGLLANSSATVLYHRVQKLEKLSREGQYSPVRQQLPELIELAHAFEQETQKQLNS